MNNIFGFIHIDFCTSSGDASVGMNIVWMKAEQNRSPVVFNLAALLWQQCTILKKRLKVGFPSIFSALHSSLCGFRKLVTQAVAAQPIVSPKCETLELRNMNAALYYAPDHYRPEIASSCQSVKQGRYIWREEKGTCRRKDTKRDTAHRQTDRHTQAPRHFRQVDIPRYPNRHSRAEEKAPQRHTQKHRQANRHPEQRPLSIFMNWNSSIKMLVFVFMFSLTSCQWHASHDWVELQTKFVHYFEIWKANWSMIEALFWKFFFRGNQQNVRWMTKYSIWVRRGTKPHLEFIHLLFFRCASISSTYPGQSVRRFVTFFRNFWALTKRWEDCASGRHVGGHVGR